MKSDLVREPTLRDLLIQHLGIGRWACVDPRVRASEKWSDWLSLVSTLDDAELQGLSASAARTTAAAFLSGRLEQLTRWGGETFETRDHYLTPGRDRPDLGRRLRERRTEGPLRDAMVDAVLKARDAVAGHAEDDATARLRETFGPSFDALGTDDSGRADQGRREGPRPAGMFDIATADRGDVDALSDWLLSDAAYHATFHAAVLGIAGRDRKGPADDADEPDPQVPTFG